MASPFDDIRIASPCHQPWDGMGLTDDEAVRFCRSCKSNVYDLRSMPREAAEALLANKAPTCVRLFKREDGRVLTKDACASKPTYMRGLEPSMGRFVIKRPSVESEDDRLPTDFAWEFISKSLTLAELKTALVAAGKRGVSEGGFVEAANVLIAKFEAGALTDDEFMDELEDAWSEACARDDGSEAE